MQTMAPAVATGAVGLGRLVAVMTAVMLSLGCTESPTEPPVPDIPTGRRLAASAVHTCLITSQGGLVCWGRFRGTIEEFPPTPVAPASDTTLRFTSISAGSVTCAISATQRLYCWGLNLYGELGDGTRLARSTPTPVATDLAFAEVGVGVYSTCARTAGGELYCWGRGDYGHLANGEAREGTVQPIPTRANTPLRFSQLSPGFMFCGLATSGPTTSGRVYCWGAISGSFDPSLYVEPGNCGAFYVWWFLGSPCVSPTPLRGNVPLVAIQRGVGQTSCGLDAAGAAYCWGAGAYGTLGNGTAGEGTYAIDPVPVDGGHRFRQVVSGGTMVCGLTEDGAAYCWGNNFRGQLGIGETPPVEWGIPVASRPLPVAGGHRFVEITVGNAHGCGLTTDEAVWCWGVGTEGQLGRAGTAGDAATPVRVVY